MTARIGICTGCGAQYGNIPPTVTATKVRCRKCGGEVEIPPLETGPEPPPQEAPQTPAETGTAPAGTAESEASKATAETPPGDLIATPLGDAKPKGNGERPASAAPVDRSVARREPAKPAARPVPKPPAPRKPVVKPPPPRKPVVKPPLPKKPAPKPPAPRAKAPQPAPPAAVVAEKKQDPDKAAALIAKLKARKVAGVQKVEAGRPADPSTDPAKGADSAKGADLLAKLKAKKAAGHEKEAAGSAPPAAARGKGIPERKRPARPKKAARRKSSGADHGEHPHQHAVKKGPPVLLTLISVIALGGTGIGLWWFLAHSGEQKAPEPEQAIAVDAPTAVEDATTTPPANDATAAPAPVDASAGEADGAGSAAADGPPDGAETANTGDEAAAAAPPVQEPVAEDPEWSPPAPGEEIPWRGYHHADSFKLELVPPLAEWANTDDETWAGFVEDADLYLADEGASSIRAGNRLVDGGRDAYPAIVNAMLKTDWSDPYSIGLCHSLNNMIVEIGHGTNLGWKDIEGLDPASKEWHDAIYFNKTVVIYWYNFWVSKFSTDDVQWTAFANKHSETKKKEADKPAEAPPPSGLDFDD